MTSPSFEAIVDDQFPPYVEAYYELRLHNIYGEIEPNSAVGRIAVELEQARLTSGEALEDLHVCTESGIKVDGDELEEITYADDLAYSRWKVFSGIYYDLDHAPAGKTYQASVSEALEREIRELDKVWMPEGTKPELLALAQEICFFLSVEDTQHFKQLAG